MNKNKITILNICSTVILQGLAFFSGPIFSSVLGTSNYGIATTYFAWVQIASIIFSLQATGTVALARVKFPQEDQPRFQSSVLSLATLSYLCFSAVTLAVVSVLSRFTNVSFLMVLVGLLHGWGMESVGFLNAKFIYEFKAGKNFILSVITSVLTIGVSLLLVLVFPREVNYWGRILGQGGVYAIMGVFIYIFTLHKGKLFYSKEYWKFTLPITIPTVFHSLSNMLMHHSDKVMLQMFTTNSDVGIYALACTFSGVLNTIWAAFNRSWTPFFYEYMKQGQIDKIRKHSKNYIELFTILCIGFVLLAREVFHLYADESFWGGTGFITLFSVGYYFIFLYSFPVNYEFYNEKTKTIAIGTTGAAICNIVLNYTFIMLWGVIGAVIATLVSHGLQFLFHYICGKRINTANFPFKMMDFIPGLLAVLAACVFYAFTKELWLIRWLAGAALGIYLLIKIVKRKSIF